MVIPCAYFEVDREFKYICEPCYLEATAVNQNIIIVIASELYWPAYLDMLHGSIKHNKINKKTKKMLNMNVTSMVTLCL